MTSDNDGGYSKAMSGDSNFQGFNGRGRELAELDLRLALAAQGQPAMVIVEGPSGIGKSALLENFFAQHDSLQILSGFGVEWESVEPFAVVEQLVRGRADAPLSGPDGVGPGGAGFNSVVPTVDRPDDGPYGSEADSARNAMKVGRRLLELVQQLQQSAPVAVVVDDLQWADPASIRALSYMVRRLHKERVMTVVTVSDEHRVNISAAAQRFLAGHQNTVIRVNPLTGAQIRDLAMAAAGIELTIPGAHHLAAHTLGNPLYTRQLLTELPPEIWQQWQPDLPAPRVFAAEVRTRLAHCGAAGRALAEAASVLGKTIPFADVAALAGTADSLAALDEAQQAGILASFGGGERQMLTFNQPLVRAAVYSQLSHTRRAELHRHAAQLALSTEQRLNHRAAASPLQNAQLAAEFEALANAKAATGQWSQTARALITSARLSTEKSLQQNRLLHAVDALIGAGQLPEAMTFLPEVESLAPSAARDTVLGYAAIMRGRRAAAETFLSNAWDSCDRSADPATAAVVAQRYVLHALAQWNGPELVEWSRTTVALAEPGSPPGVEAEAIAGLGLVAMGKRAEAFEHYARVAARVPEGAQTQRVQLGYGWAHLAFDDPQAARNELEAAVPTEYAAGSMRISLWAQAWLARTQFVLGDWDAAIRTVEEAERQLETADMDLIRPLVHWTATQVHALRGNWELAKMHMEKARASDQSYVTMLIPARLAQAQYAEAQGDYPAVVRALEPLVKLSPGADESAFWPWHDTYANALVMTERVAEASDFISPYEQHASERGHRSAAARMAYVRGRILGAQGLLEDARRSFDHALAQLEPVSLPYLRARVQFAYGMTLRRAGKRAEAAGLLHAAGDAFGFLGAQAYVDRCNRELKASGVDIARRDDSDPVSLTAQEQAVANLVAQGKSNKEVARDLYVTVKTIQYHLTRIYGKFGIRSRGELAARYRPDADADAGKT